jgi:hypothetical protein
VHPKLEDATHRTSFAIGWQRAHRLKLNRVVFGHDLIRQETTLRNNRANVQTYRAARRHNHQAVVVIAFVTVSTHNPLRENKHDTGLLSGSYGQVRVVYQLYGLETGSEARVITHVIDAHFVNEHVHAAASRCTSIMWKSGKVHSTPVQAKTTHVPNSGA